MIMAAEGVIANTPMGISFSKNQRCGIEKSSASVVGKSEIAQIIFSQSSTVMGDHTERTFKGSILTNAIETIEPTDTFPKGFDAFPSHFSGKFFNSSICSIIKLVAFSMFIISQGKQRISKSQFKKGGSTMSETLIAKVNESITALQISYKHGDAENNAWWEGRADALIGALELTCPGLGSKFREELDFIRFQKDPDGLHIELCSQNRTAPQCRAKQGRSVIIQTIKHSIRKAGNVNQKRRARLC